MDLSRLVQASHPAAVHKKEGFLEGMRTPADAGKNHAQDFISM